jgi:hypothetical protein
LCGRRLRFLPAFPGRRSQIPEFLGVLFEHQRLVVVVNYVGTAVTHLLSRLDCITMEGQVVRAERMAQADVGPGFKRVHLATRDYRDASAEKTTGMSG